MSVKQKHIKKFQAYTYDYNINFKNLEDETLTEVLPLLGGIFDSIIDRLREGVNENDRVRLVFNSPALNFPISLPFMRLDVLTAERIFARTKAVLNSYQFIKFDKTVTIHFVKSGVQTGYQITR